jgi:hypothetical protein
MKTDDEKKVELLFKFFSTPPPSSQTRLLECGNKKNHTSDGNSMSLGKGVKFDDFLRMVLSCVNEALQLSEVGSEVDLERPIIF